MRVAPMTSPDPYRARLLEMTTQIVVAAIEKGQVQPALLPELLTSVFQAMEAAASPAEAAKPVPLQPAVSIKQSVTPDYIICLEDGKRFKSMRGHLRKLGMTPDEYRQKWKLAADYPIVAPNYAARRSAMAIHHGLGTANSNGKADLPAQPAKKSNAG